MGPVGPVVQREPPLGQLRRHLDVLRSERGDVHGDPLADGVVHDLESLAETGARSLRQRHLVVGALVHQPVAPPHRAADLDDLSGARQWRVVGHAVEPLDHLGTGRSQAQDAAPLRELVDADRRHGQECRGARVEGQDARADLRPLRDRGQEPHGGHGVGAVGLARPEVLDPDVLQPLGVGCERVGVVTHPTMAPSFIDRLLSRHVRASEARAYPLGGRGALPRAQ